MVYICNPCPSPPQVRTEVEESQENQWEAVICRARAERRETASKPRQRGQRDGSAVTCSSSRGMGLDFEQGHGDSQVSRTLVPWDSMTLGTQE